MSIKIITPGPLTTVQDPGRTGYMKDGFNASGVMDKRAARLANLLVGNRENAALLEMTLFGISAKVLDRTVIAFTGADMCPKINGSPVKMNSAISLFPGDIIETSFAVSGCRAYLAFRGGIDVRPIMNSRSTNLKCKIGGFEGRKLAPDDILPVFPVTPLTEEEIEKRSLPYAPYFTDGKIKVRAIPGPQDDMFTEKALLSFFLEEYTLTPASDRMGMRLEGAPLESKNGVDIISDGIAPGSVQIPKNGMPIILLADRQTTGGYAKIATVISVDLPLLAQAKPGDKITFSRVSLKEAQDALIQEEKSFSKIRFR
ncbi:MAG: biotin-dependent carboxyltransferase family protein [Eubacteriales bacterium]